jgi:anti-sigma factor RsiW
VTDPEALAHLASCAGCAAAATDARAFEARLASALSVAVPDGLADRILAARRADMAETSQPRRRLGWIALAAAASRLVAIGVGGYHPGAH